MEYCKREKREIITQKLGRSDFRESYRSGGSLLLNLYNVGLSAPVFNSSIVFMNFKYCFICMPRFQSLEHDVVSLRHRLLGFSTYSLKKKNMPIL